MGAAIFDDRTDAGQQLAPLVARWCRTHAARSPVVVGIARGGVVVGAAVAASLDLPLGVTVVRKLGAPSRPEYAMGAIADGVRVLGDHAQTSLGVTDEDLSAVEQTERAELARRQSAYGAGAPLPEGGDVIVVDDGVATGSTAIAAVRALRRREAKRTVGRIVLAVPVAPASWQPPSEADAYLCLHGAADFWAVGQFYARFEQTSDAEVIDLLAARPRD